MKYLVAALIMAMLFSTVLMAQDSTISANPEDLISLLSYSYTENVFSGNIYTTLRGSTGGYAEVQIVNSKGKLYFKGKFKCEKTYVKVEGIDECYLSPISGSATEAIPFEDGEYTLKIFLDDKQVYALNFTILFVKNKYNDEKRLLMDGDWGDMAFINMTDSRVVTMNFYINGPDVCDGAGVEMQALVYRDNVFLLKGHAENLTYFNCSKTHTMLRLFYSDDDMLTKWASKEDFSVDGEYAVDLYIDNELAKTYWFTVSEGEIYSESPRGIQEGLQSERVHGKDGSAWIYSNEK